MLEHGATIIDLARRKDVCPSQINGRSYELWQPLLAIAAWIESLGADGLLALLQEHALRSIEAAKDEHIPEADEVLLELLAEIVKAGKPPTPGELLDAARERAPSLFGPGWTPKKVSKRLKVYKVPKTGKTDGARRYPVDLALLRKIQENYAVDLGIPGPGVRSGTSTLIDPVAA
jgi:hypothetical protein